MRAPRQSGEGGHQGIDRLVPGGHRGQVGDARGAPGQVASAAMNFEEADRTPEIELNQILWMSVHGPKAQMPPPVHAAFFRPVGNKPANTVIDDDDDDDLFDRLFKKPAAPAPTVKGPSQTKK